MNYRTSRTRLGDVHFFTVYNPKVSIALELFKKEVAHNTRITSIYCGDYDQQVDNVPVDVSNSRWYVDISYVYVETRLLNRYTSLQRETPVVERLSQKEREIASREWSCRVKDLVKKREREKREEANRNLGWDPYPPLAGEED